MSKKRYTSSDEAKSPSGDLGVASGVVSEPEMFYGAEPILFEFAKKLRDNPTDAEAFLWIFLQSNQLKGYRFKRQHPVKYFIADFYCHKAKLVIEVDGGYHTIPEQYEYDSNRDIELTQLGIKVLRFTNEEVLFEIDKVLEVIKKELNQTMPHP